VKRQKRQFRRRVGKAAEAGQFDLLADSESKSVINSPVDPQISRDLPQATPELPLVAEIRLESPDEQRSTEPSIGERLRIERERRGWSCEEVASRLKLQVGLVKRIERDDYNGIAHAVYLRGYLSSYARLLGLPLEMVEPVVERNGEQTPLVSTGTVSRSRYMLDRYSVSATYLILTALVIGPAVWLATHGGLEQNLARTVMLDGADVPIKLPLEVVASQSNSEPAIATATPAANTGTAGADAPAPVLAMQPQVQEDAQPPIVASMAPFSAVQTALPPVTMASSSARHSLTLKLSQASWVEVSTAAGEKLEYALLAAGSERSYSSEGVILVRIGNAEGAQITADGKLVDLAPYRRANVAHLRIFAEGALVSRIES